MWVSIILMKKANKRRYIVAQFGTSKRLPDQTKQMQSARTGRLRSIAGVHELFVIEDLLALHVQIDANDVLINHTTSTDVHVAHLRIAH